MIAFVVGHDIPIERLPPLAMKSPNKNSRCPWVDMTKPDYVQYHDEEWGVPVHDDRTILNS